MKEFFKYKILQFGDFSLDVLMLVKITLLTLFVFFLLYIIKKTIYKAARICRLPIFSTLQK